MEDSKWLAVSEALVASVLIVALGTLMPLLGVLMIPVVVVRTVVGGLASLVSRPQPRLLGQ